MSDDELLYEGPADTAHIWADEASRLQVAAMRRYTPSIKVKAPPALMTRWEKGAEEVRIQGRLVAWYPGLPEGEVALAAWNEARTADERRWAR